MSSRRFSLSLILMRTIWLINYALSLYVLLVPLLGFVYLKFYPLEFVIFSLVLLISLVNETRSVGYFLNSLFWICSRSIWMLDVLLFLGWGIIASRIWMILGLSFLIILRTLVLHVLNLPSVVILNVSPIVFLAINLFHVTLSVILLLLIFCVGELIFPTFSS